MKPIPKAKTAKSLGIDLVLSTTKYIDYWCAYYNIVSNFSDDEKNKLFYINAEEYYKI